MAMKYIYYIFIFLFLNSNVLNSEIINDLRSFVNSDKNETLLIFHFNITGCVKCYIEPNDILINLQKNNYLRNCKIIASVICDRDIELKIFARDNNWKYSLYRNDGTLLSRLNAAKDTFITIITTKNEIVHFKPGNPKQNFDKIVELLSKSN